MSCFLSKANTDERNPVLNLTQNLERWLFGDKGYLGLEFLEKIKKSGNRNFYQRQKEYEREIFEYASEILVG